MSRVAAALLCVSVAGWARTTAQDSAASINCTVDVSGSLGDCRSIIDCPALLEVFNNIKQQRGDRAEQIKMLRELSAKCPKQGTQSLVCCETEATEKAPELLVQTRSMLPASQWKLNTDKCGQNFVNRIIGGQNATIGQFPWMVSIQYNNMVPGDPTALRHGCGGTLITARHVLTAAHCLSSLNIDDPEPKAVVLGEVNFLDDPDCLPDQPDICAHNATVTVEIEAIQTHPFYEHDTSLALPNDICIIKLAREVEFSAWVAPICLYREPAILGETRSDLAPASNAFIAGWGQSRIEISSDEQMFTPFLQFAAVPMRGLHECEVQFKRETAGLEGRLCAGAGESGRDTCRGDSGGPLMVTDEFGTTWYQTGISSFGAGRCGQVSGYTRVLDYIDWIEETLEFL